jgi:peroxiredoxin
MLTILAVSLVILCGCENKESNAASETDETAPEFALANYDGQTISLSDYKGKIMVLEWFNYECPFVKYHYEDAKTMTRLADKYKDKNVVWLAINSTGHLVTEKNREFAVKYEVGYPILDDSSGKTGRAYGAKTTPHMFIIDTQGKIAYSGAIDNSPQGRKTDGVINYVDKALAELIDGKPISIANTPPYGCSVKYAD